MQRTIVILGSTGSIGENAIWVARALNDELTISGVAAGRRWKRVAEQVQEFGCRRAAIAEPSLHARLKQAVPSDCEVTSDHDGLIAMVTAPEVDMVLCAITGTAGLLPVLAAIRAGKDIALASKEVLVMAGELVMGEARRCGSRILPVDSEHSAIFQCLEGHAPDTISRLILTASGGPFRTLSQD
ncbi:MAG: 1-deoxy-D-xylulose-5-phosphate reductoisomerase, partial [Candidatus Pacebacteria bacterium]|nr:1-deoxy-D-xylulose-5-phosphate reductoisomerase [Candidatus Paceibacterota bacterium]